MRVFLKFFAIFPDFLRFFAIFSSDLRPPVLVDNFLIVGSASLLTLIFTSPPTRTPQAVFIIWWGQQCRQGATVWTGLTSTKPFRAVYPLYSCCLVGPGTTDCLFSLSLVPMQQTSQWWVALSSANWLDSQWTLQGSKKSPGFAVFKRPRNHSLLS